MEPRYGEPRGPSPTSPTEAGADPVEDQGLGAGRSIIPWPAESPDEALVREAMEDPAAQSLEDIHPHPTVWRVVVLMVVAIAALSVVFGLTR